MSDSVKTNWTELNEQVADLQVKAFLRVIFEMGAVLDNNGHLISTGSPAAIAQQRQAATRVPTKNPQAQTGNV